MEACYSHTDINFNPRGSTPRRLDFQTKDLRSSLLLVPNYTVRVDHLHFINEVHSGEVISAESRLKP